MHVLTYIAYSMRISIYVSVQALVNNETAKVVYFLIHLNF